MKQGKRIVKLANEISRHQNIELIVTDENAPSDKYPQWGFSVDFKDANGVKYFVEYPNFKSAPFKFVKGKKYRFDCSVKEVKSLMACYKKISRIKNIIEL